MELDSVINEKSLQDPVPPWMSWGFSPWLACLFFLSFCGSIQRHNVSHELLLTFGKNARFSFLPF